MKSNPLRVNKECEDILNKTLVEIMKLNFRNELGENL